MRKAFQNGQFTSRTNSMPRTMRPKRLGAQTFGTLFFWRLNFFIRIVGNDLIFTLGCYKSQKSTQISHQPVLTERV